jgi:hypothetical protein
MLSSNEFPFLLQTSYSGDIITHLVRVEMRLFVAENCHLAVYPALMANLCKSWIAFIFLRWLIWVTTSTCQFTKDSSTTLAVKKGLPIDEVKLQLLKLTMIAQFLSETGPSLGTHQRIGTGYLQFLYLWGSTSRVTGGLARHIFRDWWYHQFC